MGKQFFRCLRLHIIDVYATVDLIHGILPPTDMWVRRPYEIFRHIHDRFLFARSEVFGIQAEVVILRSVPLHRRSIRPVRIPVLKNSNITPDAVHVWEIAVLVGHILHELACFQIKVAVAVLLIGKLLLPVLHHKGFFCDRKVGLPEGQTIEAAPVHFVLVLRLPARKDLKRAAGDRARNKRRGSIVVIADHGIEISPILCQRGDLLAEIGRAGLVIVLAARLIAGNIARSRHRIIRLDRACVEHRERPKAAGRGRRSIYDVRPNILLRKRVSFDFYRLFRAAGGTRLHGLRRRCRHRGSVFLRGIAARKGSQQHCHANRKGKKASLHMFRLPFN